MKLETLLTAALLWGVEWYLLGWRLWWTVSFLLKVSGRSLTIELQWPF